MTNEEKSVLEYFIQQTYSTNTVLDPGETEAKTQALLTYKDLSLHWEIQTSEWTMLQQRGTQYNGNKTGPDVAWDVEGSSQDACELNPEGQVGIHCSMIDWRHGILGQGNNFNYL